ARGRSSARARPSRDGLGSREVGRGGSRTRRRASPTLVDRPPVPARSGAGGPAGERVRGIETKNSAVLAQFLRSGGGSLLLSGACARQSVPPAESGGGHDAGGDDQVAPDLLPGRFERAWLPNRQVGG